MADKRPKNPAYTTPKGLFKFPRLGEPDTKFKPDGEYSVNVVLSKDDAAELVGVAETSAAKVLAEAKKNAKNPAEAKKWETKYLPYKQVEDDQGNETGQVEFKFTMKASGVSKKTGKPWTRKPGVFDSKGKPMDGSKVWGGSIGKVNFEVQPYAATPQTGASVKFALNAVQVIELKQGMARDASAYGFSEEEGYADVAEETSTEAGKEGTESEEAQDF